jgi:uncharacterized LabA/DUF88 family protein
VKPAVVYIDGFNLYFGMKDAEMKPWLWVDLARLGDLIVPEGYYADEVRYYTARVKHPADSRQRQNDYIAANQAFNPALVVREGFMQYNPRPCKHCLKSSEHREEKQTDVNIALDMALGALDPRNRAVVLVSGDSDQVPTIRAVVDAGREAFVRFPPERHCNELKKLQPESYVIGKTKLKKAQLPATVDLHHGRRIERPRLAWGERPGIDH